MDRKWRLNRGAHETVESPIDFKRKYVDVLTERGERTADDVDSGLQRLVDVYALYTVLHIEKRVWRLQWSGRHGIYYFITERQDGVEAGGVGGVGGIGITQGDEGSGDESEGEGEEDRGIGNAGEGADEEGDEGEDDDAGSDGEGGRGGQGGRGDAVDTKETVYCDAPVEQGVDAAAVNGKQVLVPVSSGTQRLTPRVMNSFCALGKGVAQQVLLSVVDSNGTATRCCLYDYIQGPLSTRGVEATLATLPT